MYRPSPPWVPDAITIAEHAGVQWSGAYHRVLRSIDGVHIHIGTIEDRMRDHRAATLELGSNKHAAVAMVVRPGPESAEALFIERSRHDSDPWSGQMAFPGGMVEKFDADPRGAAERETLEEVGIDLSNADFLGRLDDQQGRHRSHTAGIVVRGYVYAVDADVQAVVNDEVEDVVWAPLCRFLNARNYTHIVHPVYPGERFPGVRVSEHDHQVVWGLTRRFMSSFFSALHLVFEG